jgi:hypothetical protein
VWVGGDARRPAFSVCTDGLRIDWGGGATASVFHSTWLRHNCAEYRQEHRCPHCGILIRTRPLDPPRQRSVQCSGQRIVPVMEISDKAAVVRVDSAEREATLLVEWSDGHRSLFPIAWLRAHAYDDRALELTARRRRCAS